MGYDSASARRAIKRAKHTTMTPISSALMNKAREYGARKSKPSTSMLGSFGTASYVSHVPNRVLLDISESSSEVGYARGRGGTAQPKKMKGRCTFYGLARDGPFGFRLGITAHQERLSVVARAHLSQTELVKLCYIPPIDPFELSFLYLIWNHFEFCTPWGAH